jgi:hypothetical protein
MRNSFELIPASENSYYFCGAGANFSERHSVSLLLSASVEFWFIPLDSYLHNA